MSKLISDYHFEHKDKKVQVFYKGGYITECKSITEAVNFINRGVQ